MKPCTIEGCDGRAIARGYCSRHYARWKKHRDPLAGRTKEGDVPQWLYDNAGYQGDDCLIFPFARKASGYGALKFQGKIMAASRAMCIIAHGEPPDPRLVAAHSCGKGSSGCVNPKHLRWATHAENAADLKDHQERGIVPRPKHGLPLADQRIVAALRGRVTQKVLGKRFGLTESAVCRIQLKALRKGLA